MDVRMGRQIRRRRDYRKAWLVFGGVFVAVFLFTFLTSRFKVDEEVGAASLANFDPGYIISDYQMSNYNTMTVAEIQSFLSSKGSCNNTSINVGLARGYEEFSDASGVAYNYYITFSNGTWRYHVENGHFVCLAEEKFNGVSAAQIIYDTAQEYRINPQVLIVLLQKEQGLITDSYPNNAQYRGATGYGCPDTAACDAKYYGFKNQVRNAAAMFRTVLDGGWTNYPLGNNYVQYNPSAACGGSVVNIRSLATSALYRYTPYQPNASALAAGYGVGDSCGAYGNRNFYLYFSDWFGGVQDDGGASKMPDEMRKLVEEKKEELGVAKTDVRLESDGRVWQTFEKGTVIYHASTGAHAVLNGVVADKWAQMGGSLGSLGKPKNDTRTESDGRVWQTFEKGTVIYHASTGAHAVLNGVVADKWAQMGGSLGALGRPSGDAEKNDEWSWQDFEKGGVVYNLKSKETIVFTDIKIYEGWKQNVIIEGVDLGMPVSTQRVEGDGRHWQTFENGILIYHADTGAHVVLNGPIHDAWAKAGGSVNGYGRPIENQVATGGVVSQKFANGIIKIEL